MMRVIGLLLTLYLALMVVQIGMALAIVLGFIGLGIGLIFRTKETLELLAGLISIALFCRFPIPYMTLIVLAVIVAALGA